MTTTHEQFRFVGCSQPDTIIGERVVLRHPVTPPPLDAQNRISLEAFELFFRELRQTLLGRYGTDCADFELEFGGDGAISVIFTRPMDVVEQTQIRAYRLRQQEGAVNENLSDDDLIARQSRTATVNRSLPDPSVPTLNPVLMP